MRRACAALALLCLALAAARPAHAAGDDPAAAIAAVPGEVMDIAVENCRRGERDQALALFAAIRAQMDPPAPIRHLIEELEATGCSAPALADAGVLRVQGGGGWDSNVSQGITARTLVLGSGDTTLELALDPSYKPRSTAYAQVAADYSMNLPRLGIGLQFAAGTRQNFNAPDFDLTTLSAAASREFRLGPGTLRAQLELSQLWLGGHSYLGGTTATLQWLRPDEQGAWLATLRDGLSHYRTQATQDARQRELGVLREQRLDASASVHAGFSLQRDDARGLRPGGDRRGWQAQLGSVLSVQGWRVQPELSFTRWDSNDLFAPGLLDVQRRNRLAQLLVQAERPLAPGSSLLLEWRGRWARDTVALYSYQAQVLSATFIRRF